MTTSKETMTLSALSEMFHDILPDEYFLQENEELAQDIARIDEMLHDVQLPAFDKIKELYEFNSEWYPDSADEDITKEYDAALENAKEILFPAPEDTPKPFKKKTLPLFARFDGYIMCDVELFEKDEDEAVRQAIQAGDFKVENTGYVPDVAYQTNDTMLAPQDEIDF